MQDKSSTCLGCPLYADGKGFVPDAIVENSRVAILAQNPGADEERQGRPMVGATGQLQDERFLPLAGLERKDVSVLNVLKCRYIIGGKKVNDLPPEDILEQAVEHCTRAHLRIPEHITNVILQGALALKWATGRGDMAMWKWRGHVVGYEGQRRPHRLGQRNAYVVEHLANLVRDQKAWFLTELDWRRAGRWLDGQYPRPIPEALILGKGWAGDLKLVEDWFEGASHSRYVTIDTEYVGGGHPSDPGYMTILGMGYLGGDGVPHGLQVQWDGVDAWVKEFVSRRLRALVTLVPVLVQNYAADLPVLRSACGIQYDEYMRVDDTMLLHGVLYSELPHSLEFLDSLYGWYPKLKHLSEEDPLLYNWGDVLSTIAIWEGILTTCKGDQQAWEVYETQSRALIPTLLRSMERGIKVNKRRVLELKEELERQAAEATAIAQCHTGWKINLGSDDQVKYWAYHYKNHPLVTDKDTGNPTLSQDALAELREIEGPAISDKDELCTELILKRIAEGGDPVLEARALYQDAQHLLDAYIYSLHRSVVAAEGEDEKKRARTRVKGIPWTVDDIVDRVYPHFAIHTQKTGRWSTSDPPLAQLPEHMRDLIQPDPGHVWLAWDWSGIESQILEVECGSDLLREAHEKGLDEHVWRLCLIAGYDLPPNLKDPHKSPECAAWREKYNWKGKDDPRRIFAKSAFYELIFGGVKGSNAARKAARMGIDARLVKQFAERLQDADPQYSKFKRMIEDLVRRTRIVRTFMGRPRRFLGVSRSGYGVSQKVLREALNIKMQGGVSDIFNTTLLLIERELPQTAFVFGVHDSQYHSIPREMITSSVLGCVEKIVTRPFTINGREKRFPASFKLITPPDEPGMSWEEVREGTQNEVHTSD